MFCLFLVGWTFNNLFFSSPNRGVYNFGFDNRDNDLIVYVNDILETPSGERYIVVDLFGAGTFGQVLCIVAITDNRWIPTECGVV